MFWRKKNRKPKENASLCAKSLENQRKTIVLEQKAQTTKGKQLFWRKKLRTKLATAMIAKAKLAKAKLAKPKLAKAKASYNNKAYKITVWGSRSGVIY